MDKASSRSIIARIHAFMAIALVCIVSIAIWSARLSLQRTHEGAAVTTNNLVAAIERELGESLEKLDVSNQTIVAEIQLELQGHGKVDPEILRKFLLIQKELAPEIEYIGVTDTQGLINTDDASPVSERSSVAGHDYFLQLRDHPEIKSVMYGPLIGRAGKKWVVGFAARFNDQHGNFGGVVFSAIPVAVIQRQLEALNLGKSGAVTVRTETLALVARATAQRTDPVNDLGSTKVSEQLQAAMAAQPKKGSFIAKTALDQIERINSYSKVSAYPMYVILGLATEDLVAGLSSEIIVISTLAALASAIALSAAWLLTRSLKQQQSFVGTLRESEARYTRVVEGADEGIWEWNFKTARVVVSARFQSMLGYAPGEWNVSPESWMNHIHPDDRATMMEALNQHLAGETASYVSEFRMHTKAGDWIWVQSRGKLVSSDASGNPELISGTHTDITVRKDLEIKLMTLNQDFVAFLEHTGDFVYFKDHDSRFRFCSQTLAEITGHTSWRDMLGKHDLEVFPPETAQVYQAEEIPVFRDGVPLLNKVDPYLDQNAQAGWISTNKWPLLDDAGKVCGLFGISRIVTDQIRLQQEHNALLALQKAILDNELVPIMAAKGRRIHWFNPAFAKLFGHDQGELIGMSTRGGYCNDDDYESFGAQAYAALKNGGFYRAECECQRKDGSRFVADISGTNLATEADVSLWFFVDVTVRKRSEETIRQLAFYDPLTKLPNRRLFGDRLAQTLAHCERNKAYGTLFVLDLDNFKPINDRHGHPTGDLFLQETARRLSSCIRETDTVGRFGGDEFVVVLGPLTGNRNESAQFAMAIAEKIRLVINEPYELAVPGDKLSATSVTHLCSASIGAVLFFGNQVDADELFRQADAAMYQAKNAGKDRVKLNNIVAA